MLLGDEIGELADYENYLKKFVEQPVSRISSFSGKKIWLLDGGFCPSARFVGFDEIDFSKAAGASLSINELKDIDSIIGAFKERFVYAGSLLLGNCGDIEDSHQCSDAFFIKHSLKVSDSKFVAYSFWHRFCEYLFGCNYTGDAKFGIKATQFYKSSRCMEVCLTMLSSDCYFTANLENCHDCMFSFNQKNKRCMIGNLSLAPGKYASIKSSLLGQIRSELETKKNVMSIQELLGAAPGAPLHGTGRRAAAPLPLQALPAPQKEAEEAFQAATLAVLGKKLQGIQNYAPWLSRNVRLPILSKSAQSSEQALVVPLIAYSSWQKRMVSFEEAWEMGKAHLAEHEACGLALSNAKKSVEKIAYSTSELRMFENSNVVACPNYYTTSDCYFGTYHIAKKSGFSFGAREVENVFGCDNALYSKFCLKCHHSYNLTRCFEVSDSRQCSDSYFCHNVENCQECMFCFNVKNKKYAIGNVEYPREEYLKVKALLLRQFADELERTKSLKYDIYNIGCAKGK